MMWKELQLVAMACAHCRRLASAGIEGFIADPARQEASASDEGLCDFFL